VTTSTTKYDVIVVDSGAGGFSAAVTAAHHGLRVTVLERTEVCGGAAARSGGWMWAPGNPLARADGVDEGEAIVRASPTAS
jgi:succinate dehydrogenase/fumarate reductase flavoprotein subunit